MIRSSKVSLKFANTGKKDQLGLFLDEYTRVVGQFVALLWERSATQNIPMLLPRSLTEQVRTWLSARALQAAGKQASGIVRGTRQKQKQRGYVYQKLLAEGKNKQANRLKQIIDQAQVGCPESVGSYAELDSRFIKTVMDADGHFDGWVELGSIGDRLKIKLPFRQTAHLNKLKQSGQMLAGCRLSKNAVVFNFNLPDVPAKQNGQTLGIDIGMNKAFTCSDSQMAGADQHGHTLASICTKLARKKSGSRAFGAAQSHRTNYVNWSLNRLDLDGVKTIVVEKIANLRRGRKTSRYLNRFTYTEIFRKITDRAVLTGVQIRTVDPQFTSQRCSCCGWVRSTNRKGESFRCGSCGFTADADLNAAINIGAQLVALPPQARQRKLNKIGFYWAEVGAEPIVPLATNPMG